ncbi:hypothetical protein ACLOJK_002087 [Asimina triloba]
MGRKTEDCGEEVGISGQCVEEVALELTEEERKQIENMEDVEGWYVEMEFIKCDLDSSQVASFAKTKRNISCPIVGCGAQLNSLDNFEDHYHTRHTASCSVCWRVYPTSRLLSIHVSEAHDSFFLAKVARGFPMKAHPSKKKRQKCQRKQADRKREEGKESEMEVEQKIDELASAVSKLSTTDSSPTTISFGRRHAHGFSFLPRAVQKNRRHGSSQEFQKDSTMSGNQQTHTKRYVDHYLVYCSERGGYPPYSHALILMPFHVAATKNNRQLKRSILANSAVLNTAFISCLDAMKYRALVPLRVSVGG